MQSICLTTEIGLEEKLDLKQEENSLEMMIIIIFAITKMQDFIVAKLLLHIIQIMYWFTVLFIKVTLRKIINSLIIQSYSQFLSFLSIRISFIAEFIRFWDLEQFFYLMARIEVKEDADLTRQDYSVKWVADLELEYEKNLSLQ